MNSEYNPLDEGSFKYFYIKWTTLNTAAAAELSTRFAKVCKGFVKFSLSDKEAFDLDKSRITAIDFKVRIAPGERYMLTNKGLVTVTPGKPIIWLSYQKALNGVLDCPFNYDKLQLQLTHSWIIRYLGKSKLTLQAGYLFGDTPLFENFDIFANYDDFGLYSTESFATMRINEFICDKFVLMFFNHNFGKFFKTKRFSPDFIFETNIGWGETSMKDGYFESGLILDNVLNVNVSHIGLGAFYRYGAYSFDKVIDNFAFKLKISFRL